ncbi:MAG TPA: Crp/Fnr family transcriptional regulator [Caulobacteraceae bacterium]|jgi:CRP-like cAMP-binding protein|nr:Crp/Fnr family transcriptional regulator [Caulobacteraceae bacterium]
MDIRNRLLASFGDPALAALSPHVHEIALSLGRVVAEPGEPVDHVYFPSSGVISIITLLEDGRRVESLTVGREGAVGLLTAFGDPVWRSRGLVQIAGAALRIEAAALRAAAARHPAIIDHVVRYAQVTEAQLHQSAACNALHDIEARLCRWLLTCEDRVGDNVLPLTHEFLGMMLGVQRTRVTTAAQALQRRGLIDYRRGLITVKDRPGMEQASCECYRTGEGIYARIFPGRVPSPQGV